METHKINTSAQQSHWFHNTLMQDYKPPSTTPYKELIGPSLLLEKEHSLDPKQLENNKGCRFDKSKRSSPFKGNEDTPGAGHYFKEKGNIVKKSPKKTLFLHRNPQEKKLTVGVGDYNLFDINRSISFNKGSTITTKDQKINYFELHAHNRQEIPGPGTYDYKTNSKLTKSRSLKIYKTPERPCCSLQKDTNAKGIKMKKESPSPFTYKIQRTKSVGCSAILKVPYRQSDSRMNRRLKDYRRQKENLLKTGPGKYLNLGSMEKGKYPNGYVNPSMPKMRIYT